MIRERRANTEAAESVQDEPQPISRCGRRHESSIAVSVLRIYTFDTRYACIQKIPDSHLMNRLRESISISSSAIFLPCLSVLVRYTRRSRRHHQLRWPS